VAVVTLDKDAEHPLEMAAVTFSIQARHSERAVWRRSISELHEPGWLLRFVQGGSDGGGVQQFCNSEGGAEARSGAPRSPGFVACRAIV
jgi:hypothetical protein